MNAVLTTCSTCGDVELAPADVTVHTDSLEGPGDYVFRCPECGLSNVVVADARTVDLLIAAGAGHQMWQSVGR